MDPGQPDQGAGRARLPRTRGDGPHDMCAADRGAGASPHTRGWTRRRHARGAARRGFPAHAGMDPGGHRADRGRGGLPRTRGDGPFPASAPAAMVAASPHTRGWTHLFPEGVLLSAGFPAHAGMDPGSRGGATRRGRLPRTRGDGPSPMTGRTPRRRASPHTRGWTRAGPAHVGRARGFPAHAGMDPSWSCRASRTGRLPRTRGDGPDQPWSVSAVT